MINKYPVLSSGNIENIFHSTSENTTLFSQDTHIEKKELFEDIPLHKMQITTLLDGIGFYGPIIVIFIIMFSLQKQPKYMWVYFIGVFVNNHINRVLKLIFLEERPKNPVPFSKYEKYKNVEAYGMPSGHASSIGFSIIYFLLVKSNSVWLPICICIGILTLYQRVKYRRHTAKQIFTGLITGSVFGWTVYVLATRYILWL